MNTQELIEAINAEIAKTQVEISKVKLGTKIAEITALNHIAYINGLRFTKELIEKAKEVTE